jgi:very-short-patch-repair endonuclease
MEVDYNLGYKEAVEDHVRILNRGPQNFYFPLCQHCGKEVKSPFYDKKKKYTCSLCKLMTDAEPKAEIANETKDHRLFTAVTRLCAFANIDDYEKAIEVVRKVLYRPGWFDSTEEVMVALELIKNGYKINHQVPLKRYRLDFVIADQKVILEIDGPFHTEKTKAREQLRDDIAIASLGPDWEVLRISTDDINQNVTKLSEAIETSVSRRRELRELHNGQIPDWYNDREKYSNKKKLTKSVKIRVNKDI